MSSIRYTGNVKWFNNKIGFGFITVCNKGEHYNKDIFVHYSSICVLDSQYKYLIQGEYVDFTLSDKVCGSRYEHQAINVCGVQDGPIMCELKKQPMITKDKKEKTVNENDGYVKVVRGVSDKKKGQDKKGKIFPKHLNHVI